MRSSSSWPPAVAGAGQPTPGSCWGIKLASLHCDTAELGWWGQREEYWKKEGRKPQAAGSAFMSCRQNASAVAALDFPYPSDACSCNYHTRLWLPHNLPLSIFYWPGPGSALPHCFTMRSITIPVLHPFVHNIGQKKTSLPFPLSYTSHSVLPCWVHSVLCTCHSDRDSVSVGCSVKQNGLEAEQITASMLFNGYLQVILCAFGSCCVWLQSQQNFSIIWEIKRL